MQASHLAGVQIPLGAKHRSRVAAVIGTVTERASDPLLLGRIVGHDVRPPHPVQLQAVFERAQESIGVDEADGVVAPDVSAVAQRCERRQRLGDTQRLVSTAVDELQQLNRELDVAQGHRDRV